MICPKCGAENDCRGRYCLNCGWDLDYVPPKKNKGKLIGIIIAAVIVIAAAAVAAYLLLGQEKIYVIDKIDHADFEQNYEYVYTYNDDGTPASIKWTSSDIDTNYHANGGTEFTYNLDRKTITANEHNDTTEVSSRVVYTYDDSGRIVQAAVYWTDEDSKPYEQIVYEYNETGELITATAYWLQDDGADYGGNVEQYRKEVAYVKNFTYTDGTLTSIEASYARNPFEPTTFLFTYNSDGTEITSKTDNVERHIYLKPVSNKSNINLELFMLILANG